MRPSLRRALLRPWLVWSRLSAPSIFVASFAGLIVVGTAGLQLLPGLVRGEPLTFVEALFTMTSAVCVTGLVVVDTATRFTLLGQAWIMVFIQLGGLGLITLTTLVIGALGKRLSLRSEMIVGVPNDPHERRSVAALAAAVARYTLTAELVGAALLWASWAPSMGARTALWHAVFHSVSAFCNAGFSTFSDSLVSMSREPIPLAVVMGLIVSGGFGYLSTDELVLRWRRRGQRARLSVHTFVALWMTVGLLVLGWIGYAVAEWSMGLSSFGIIDRLTNALFMSVTARTAGFNTVPYAELSNAGVMLTIVLMLIGGSPGSTAGGLKTTTVAVMGALAFARVRGRRHAVLNGRTIPDGTVQRTTSLVLIATLFLLLLITLLTVVETGGQEREAARAAFLPLIFEAVSAFGTVGLSMDVTPALGVAGRLLVIVLMFVGRVGPLGFFAAISLRARPRSIEVREAAEDLIVG